MACKRSRVRLSYSPRNCGCPQRELESAAIFLLRCNLKNMKLLQFIVSVFPLLFLSCGTHQCHLEYDTVFAEVSSDKELDNAIKVLQRDSLDSDLFQKVWRYETKNGMYEAVMESAGKAYERGVQCKKSELSVSAAAYISQLYLLWKNRDSTDLWISRALSGLKSLGNKDKFLSAMVNNIAGIQAIQTRVDYSSALRYFKTALESIEQTKDTASCAILLRNIAQIYNVREDVSGLNYAKRSYDIVSWEDNAKIKSAAALILSRMYSLKGDKQLARKYADESLSRISDTILTDDNFRSYAYYNYGDICAEEGDDSSAERYYIKSLSYLSSGETAVDIRALTSYGSLCLRQKRYEEAISLFLRAESYFDGSNLESQAPVLSGLSRVYDVVGDKDKALEYYKKYYDVSTRTINFRNENAFSDLLLKYEQSENARELSLKEMEILKKDRNMIITLLVLCVLLISLASSFYIILEKNALNRKLVQQNLNYRERLNEEKERKKVQKQSRHNSMLKIYEELERKMKCEKLYRQKDLTLQMLAENLGTNTTYMSEVINSFSGKSFTGYVNAYRMEEVLAVLSDPYNEEPLNSIFERAGYSSRTTYLRIFRTEVGCTPSQYREEVCRMSSEKCSKT